MHKYKLYNKLNSRFLLITFLLLVNIGYSQVLETAEMEAYDDYYSYQNNYAERLLMFKNTDSINKAIDIWHVIKYNNQNISVGVVANSSKISPSLGKQIESNLIQAYEENAKLYMQKGDLNLALNSYGEKMELVNSNQIKDYTNLILSDSLMNKLSSRSPSTQRALVIKTRNYIESISEDLLDKLKIKDADEAYGVLEELVFKGEWAEMILKSEPKNKNVYYRRWYSRKADNSDWTFVRTDTVILVKRAKYQIKYFDGQDDVMESINCPCVPPIIQKK